MVRYRSLQTNNVVSKLAYTINVIAFTRENEIMKFISLYKDLMHSSYLMTQHTGSYNKKRTHPTPHPLLHKKIIINKQKHGNYSKLFNE